MTLSPRVQPVRRLWMVALFVGGLGTGSVQASTEADAAQARLIQEVLPNLDARAARASAQTAAAQSLFAGSGSLAAAFPDLATAPLFSRGFISSSQKALQARAKKRAVERIAAPPAHLSPPLVARWRTAHQGTLDAEKQADDARGRVLAALSAGLDLAPELSESRTEAMETQWRQLRAVNPDSDPEAQKLARFAGKAAAKLTQVRAAAIRRMVVPDDPTLENLLSTDLAAPLPTGETWPAIKALRIEARLERLARAGPLADDPTPLIARVAALRLALIQQTLPALRAATEQAETARLAADQEVAVETIDELRNQAESTRLALDFARQAAEAAGVDPLGTGSGPIDEQHRLLVQLASVEHDAAKARIARRTRLAESGLALDAQATDADIAEARTVAEAARKRAEDAADGERTAAQLKVMIADLRSEIAQLLEAEGTRHDAAVARYEGLRQEVDEHAQATTVALTLSPLTLDRDNRVDSAYRSMMGTIGQIRAERASLSDTLRTAATQQGSKTMLDKDAPESEELSLAMADLANTHQSIEQNIEGEIDAILALLSEAKSLRRRIHDRTSPATRRGAGLIPEVIRELQEVPALARSSVRQRTRQMVHLPSNLIHMNALGGWLLAGIEFIALLIGWALVRRRCGDWIDAGLAAIDPAGMRRMRPWERAKIYPRWMVSGDLKALGPPLADVAHALTDVAVAGCVLSFLTPRLPTLGLLAYIVVGAGMVRLVPGIVGIIIITPSDSRPALRVISAVVRDRLLWTIRIVVLWLAIEWGLVYLAVEVLDADRLAQLINIVGSIGLVLIGLIALYRWSAVIQTQVRDEGGALEKWVVRKGAGPLFTTLQSLVGTGILFIRWCARIGSRVIDKRAGLSWIGAALARRQLKDDEDNTALPLDPDVIEAVAAAAPDRSSSGPSAERILSVFKEWQTEHRHGMVALIGDRGMGKRRMLDKIIPVLGADNGLLELAPSQRFTDPTEALRWLADAAGIGPLDLDSKTPGISAQAETVAAALREREQTVFVVRDMHRLFLRSVGRFQALRAVLVAMQASSRDHFWLCSFHGPAWSFLDGIGEVVNLAGFQERVILDPMTPTALSTWLEGATRAAGQEPTYDRLLHRESDGAERTRMLDRAARAYWRLLAEASQGNPSVALDYWLNGLRCSPKAHTVEVGLFQTPEAVDLDDLGDTDLFTLTALIIHDGASLDELHESLNLTAGEVRSTCRSLESRAVIQANNSGDFFRVTDQWLPAVERLLRRRSFLHRR